MGRAMQAQQARIPTFEPLRLASFTQGNPLLERELLDLYVQTAGGYLAQLAAAGKDPVAWRKAAHALKGASLNIGAVALGELARAAEASHPSAFALQILTEAFATLQEALGREPAMAGT